MSNLASRSHEWRDWEIRELLIEIPQSAQSKGRRREHFRIVLLVNWRVEGRCTYVLREKSSPTEVLWSRQAREKQSLGFARILAKQVKDSQGQYRARDAARLDKYLTRS